MADGSQSLLADTLFDIPLTREMLAVMRDAAGVGGEDVDILVNTHANGDHTHGSACCGRAEIIASEASVREMEGLGPKTLAALQAGAAGLGEDGRYFASIFAPLDFEGVVERLPTRTISGELEIRVGTAPIRLIEVGPAHTRGDVLIRLPEARKVFTGDILFIDGAPIMWAGPVRNWIAACDRILAMDVDAIVPGHGPITDKAGVERVKAYLACCDREARKRFDAGLSVREAAHDIALGDFSSWGDSERIAVNADTLYREYRGDPAPSDPLSLFALMAELRR